MEHYFNVIGKPIKIAFLEVAQYDFPNEMNWHDANSACSKLGIGWRLPMKSHLNSLYQNKQIIGGFRNSNYWSSSEYESLYDHFEGYAWAQLFTDGTQYWGINSTTCYVRAVRYQMQF
jgi:hypothetical protein